MGAWDVKPGSFLDRFLETFPHIETSYKKAQFAKILGVKRGAITRWVKGDDPRGEETRHAIYRFLEQEGVTLEGQRWIIDKFGERPTKMFYAPENNAVGGDTSR